ncbi:TetR/AcrR family transcriptional regulator [Glycocaulis profundi]|nr:TetR/AcrR family transcriptional regulator [Glycocaulis profundi]
MSDAQTPRRRRTPEQARDESIASARSLLLSKGPEAVTLAAIGAEIGMTHANLIYHFGSAAGLRSAVMASMVADLTDTLDKMIIRLRTDEGAPLDIVSTVFEAFDEGGAARLAAWIVSSGELSHLQPVEAAVQDLVEAIREKLGDDDGLARDRIRAAVLFIALSATGDALIGRPLGEMLEQPEDAGRRIVADLLPHFLVQPPRTAPATQE